MRHYTNIACDRCGDMSEILNTATDEVGDRFVCNRCLRALVQERLNEPETAELTSATKAEIPALSTIKLFGTTAPASTDFTPDATTPEEYDEWPTAGCEKSDPSEVELDSDLIADLKQQLDLATDSSDFWYEQSMAGWKSAARLNELLKSKEADLENERRAGDAMQESLANLRNENAKLQESQDILYSRKEFLESRLAYYRERYFEELQYRVDADQRLYRLRSLWVVRLGAWLRGIWRYNIYCETCAKGED